MDAFDRDLERMLKYYQGKPNIGFIYILKAENGLYKIGKTKNPKARISAIKTSSPLKLELYGLYKSVDYDGIEFALHEGYKEKREKGEWFKLNQNDLDEIEKLSHGTLLRKVYT